MTDTSFSALREFLASPARPAGTLKYHELQGFLFAVACSPDPVDPAEWPPVVFANEPAGFASDAEQTFILGEMTRLYDEINVGVTEGKATLPADCAPRADAVANFEPDAPIGQWSRGFMDGDQWLSEGWDLELPDDLEEELESSLMNLSFFCEREQVEELAREGEFGDETVAQIAQRAVEQFEDAMTSYAVLGRHVLAPAFAEAAEEPLEPRRVTKIGRNDPCPCGSGKKFKQCCGTAA